MIKSDIVSTQSKAVQEMAFFWPIVNVLMGGTSAIRREGKAYLPKWPAESDESYRARLGAATLAPIFKRTVEILASKPFSKPLSVTTSARIESWTNDIDLQGRNLHSFASMIFQDCVSHGISGVLVESPVKNSGIVTVADEKAAGIRPYFVHYPAGTVLGWREERLNGTTKLTQLRLRERRVEPEGLYGEREVEYVRVLTPGAWQLWRQDEKTFGENWIMVDEGATDLPEIPFVPFYGDRKGFMTGFPPLIELAYQNVEHYQSSSDQQTILHAARVPILTIIGVEMDQQINIGASAAVKLPIGASMAFVEHSGAAIGAGRQAIIDLEERMRQTGAELLVLQPGKITATQVYSEDEGNKCALQKIAENFEDALDQCLQFMADLSGESEGGSVELFKDFGAASLSDASAQLLLQTNVAGKISDETLIEEFKRRGILSPETDPGKERDLIDSQGPAMGTLSNAA